jgi:hypothetical protein
MENQHSFLNISPFDEDCLICTNQLISHWCQSIHEQLGKDFEINIKKTYGYVLFN